MVGKGKEQDLGVKPERAQKGLEMKVVNGVQFEVEGDVPLEVMEHISKSIVPTNDSSAICVDGRYTQEEVRGMLARAGGDLGYSMALAGLKDISPQEAFEIIYKFRQQEGGTYGFHTDDHGEGKGHLEHCGCGHCKTGMSKGAELYTATYQAITELWNVVNLAQLENESAFTKIELQGGHAEQGVFRIKGTQWTVNANSGENQFFIYDMDRDNALVSRIVAFAQTKLGITLDEEGFRTILEQQTDSTLGSLKTSQGSPIYDVEITDNAGQKTVKVSKVGTAPDFSEQAA